MLGSGVCLKVVKSPMHNLFSGWLRAIYEIKWVWRGPMKNIRPER